MDNKNNNKIGLVSATIICMNAMIGVGIFTTPAKLATTVGPAGILTYLFVIVAVLFMALSIARVAQAYPQEGSFYTYTKQWAGHTMGLIAASSYILGIIIALGLLAKIAAQYFYAFLPIFDQQIYGIIIVSAIVALNLAGAKIMQTGQIVLLASTLFALFSTIILGFFNAKYQNLFPFMPYGWPSLFQAMSTAVFAFLGFESATSLYSIVKKPETNVPRAIILSLIIVGAIYLAFITAIILSIPQSIFTSAAMPLSEAISTVFTEYTWLSNIIGIAILAAICGVLQSLIYSCATLTRSLLKNSDTKIADYLVNSKHGFQIIILAIGFLILFNYFVLKDLGLFFNLTATFILFAFIMSMLALPLNKIPKNLTEKIITFLGLITACIIFLNALYRVLQAIKLI